MTAHTSDFLERAADARRRRIEALQRDLPGYRLRERLGVARPAGRLERALHRAAPTDPLRLLCGIARATPAAGVIRAELDPAALARQSEAGGATAIAVVIEPDRWQGDPAWVDAVHGATRLPVLVEDIVVDEYQLLDAAVRGADGVQLIATITSDVQLQVWVSRARMLGLDPLVQVRDRGELVRALKAGATLVGLGGWGADGVEADLVAAIEIAPAVPGLVTAVAWGGASAPADLARLRATRCDAARLGPSLLAGPDAAAALAALGAAARG